MKKGVDVSQFQQGLKMTEVKAAGYGFAVLRAGYTGYGVGRVKRKDPDFETFYKQAKECKLPVGAYWYSCANDAASGKAEAEFLIENCLKGKQFEFPIYIDVEETRWQSNDKNGVTDAVIAFCETLENRGYFAGVYASLDWFNRKIDTKRLEVYTKWVAAWRSTKPAFGFTGFDLWQNSSTGKIGKKRVDTDIAYKDFTSAIKKAGLNGFKKPAEKTTDKKVGGTEKKKTVEEIAKEVIDGKWGNGDERKQRLTEAGYNYESVQKKVNQLLK
jgi:GH25 family lysozyme M1 (1,4-beta-N-acetylmuramidase)